MSWRTPTEADLVATISQKEIDAYKRSVSDTDSADPVGILIQRTAEFVRGFIRTGGVAMSPWRGLCPKA